MQVQQVGEVGPVVPGISQVRSLPSGVPERPRATLRTPSTRRHPLTYITRVRRPGRGTPVSRGGDYIAHLKQDGRARRDVHPHPRGVFAGGLDGTVDRGVGSPVGCRVRGSVGRPVRGRRLQGLCRVRHRRPRRQGLQRPGHEGPHGRQGARLHDRLRRSAGRDRLRGQHPAPDRRGLPDDRHRRLHSGAGDHRGDPRQPERRRSPRSTRLGTKPAPTSPWARRTTSPFPPNFTGLDFQIDRGRHARRLPRGRLSARPARSAPTAASRSRA